MKQLDIRRLFKLEEGDRFYFVNDKQRIMYQFDHSEDTPTREYEGWRIEHGFRTVYYRNDNKKLFSKTHDFDVVFIRNVK